MSTQFADSNEIKVLTLFCCTCSKLILVSILTPKAIVLKVKYFCQFNETL